MATKKQNNTSKNVEVDQTTQVNEERIIANYMDYVLETGERPKSVYKFSKDSGIGEQDFYRFFGSFEGLRQRIWIAFYDNTIAVLHKDENYRKYPNKEKLLSFYFTFFELLTANRSYVLFSLEEHPENMKGIGQLRKLRNKIKNYASELIEEENEQKNYKVTKNPVNLFSEGAWVQFLFLLRYWMKDDSAGFEKTDVAIEKSVKVVFDVFETTPLESVIDFGKFLFKDRFTHS